MIKAKFTISSMVKDFAKTMVMGLQLYIYDKVSHSGHMSFSEHISNTAKTAKDGEVTSEMYTI